MVPFAAVFSVVFDCCGAIAGIIIALVALTADTESITKYMETHNPFFKGDSSDALSLIPFVLLMLLLYLAGRERFLAPKKTS